MTKMTDHVIERALGSSMDVTRDHRAALVANGKTNKEIANSLDLSEKTVKNHVRNIFHKLQAYDRTQAAILAIRKGLIELEPRLCKKSPRILEY
jgi:DNA-binding NarL/FixJ family response regulator